MLTKEKLLAALMSIVAALGAWNLRATLDVADRLARIEERQIAAQRTDEELRARIVAAEARILAVEIHVAEQRRTRL
jgi:hypothetical protein